MGGLKVFINEEGERGESGIGREEEEGKRKERVGHLMDGSFIGLPHLG